MTAKKLKRGRPKLPKGSVKEVFSLRLSSGERLEIEKAAKRRGKAATQWAREALLERACAEV